MIRLRCWARRQSDGALCEAVCGERHDRDEGAVVHWVADVNGEPWYDEHCAPDAGPDGRKTAALQILELSHVADRESFLRGNDSVFPDRLRAVAALLLVSSTDAKEDLEMLGREIADAQEWLKSFSAQDAAGARAVVQSVEEVLKASAEILRPWAEGGR